MPSLIPPTPIPPLALEISGTAAALLVFFWLPSSIYIITSYAFPSFSQRHKTQPSEPLPTRTEIINCALNVFRNQLLGFAIQIAVHTATLNLLGVTPYRHGPTSIRGVAWDIGLCLPICEVVFYSLHRFLHQPWLYRRIHKVHHTFTAPVALAAQYSHPIEYVLTCYLPVMVSPILVRANVVSLWAFVAMVGFESCSVHSGFRVGRLAEKHDLHHVAGSHGGYGTFEFLDWLCGTELRSMRSEKGTAIPAVERDENEL
ncbi:fatty acid hydroxylase superfamily-domain-containing protein [Pyronema domesticum]|nr:fatty acid hydroxylase superfamily-domain-containing protein [Pyronema domesticum]